LTYYPRYIILSSRKEIKMNTLLVIGIGFITIGFILLVISEIMIRYYDRKLWELENLGKIKE